MTLHEVGLKHKTDKTNHKYLFWYEQMFGHLRNVPVRLLEIGVQNGYSIAMWLEYFSQGRIYGVDIGDCKSPVHPNYTFFRGDQSAIATWEKFIATHGGNLDVVIDDGSHKPDGIITSFVNLWPQVKPGGFYAIEDLFCAYRAEYQVKGWTNSINFVKDWLDDINHGAQGIERLHFTKELVILQKATT